MLMQQQTGADASAATAIPHAPGLPIAGNAFSMAADLSGFLTRCYQELGPVFRVRAFGRRFVVLAGPEANRFMRREAQPHLRSWDVWADFHRELDSMRSVLNMDGPDHLRMRKVQTRGYGRRQILDQVSEAVRITRDEIERWPVGAPVGGHRALQHIIVEQLGVLLAGVSARAWADDLILFLEALLKARVTRHHPGFMMRRPRVRRARRRLEELYQTVRRSRDEANGTAAAVLIDDLLALHQSDPAFLPDSDLRVSLLGPFLAGLDTTANVCAFMLYELLRRPDLRALATEEADALFADGPPTAEAVKGLDVLPRIGMEVMRLYPVAPALLRRAVNSFEFAGHEVPAGAFVLVGTTIAHRLAEHFPDPDRFDIDRYQPGRGEHLPEGVFAPFGSGPHRCLGHALAEAQVALTMATILHAAELVLDPPDYRLKLRQAPTLHPDRSFRFRMTARRNQAEGGYLSG